MAATTAFSTSSPSSVGASNLPAAVAGPTSKRSKPIRVPPKISIGDINPNNIGTLRKLNSVLFPVRYSDRFYKEVLAPEVEDYCKLVYYNDIPVGAICCRIERNERSTTAEESASASTSATNGQHEPSQPTGKLYLMTLGILAPYRRQGLATKLLSHVIEKATEASLAASLTPVPSKPVPEPPASSSSTPAVQTAPAAAKADKKGKNKGKAVVTPAVPAPASVPIPEGKTDNTAIVESAKPSPILKNIFVHVQINNEDGKSFWQGNGFEEKEVIKDYYKKDVQGPRDAWLLERAIDI